MNILYVYCNPDPKSFKTSLGTLPGIPFYVGIGSPKRKYDHLQMVRLGYVPKKSNQKHDHIKKLFDCNTLPIIVEIKSGLAVTEAKQLEISLIAEIGTVKEVKYVSKRGPLLNEHRGGGGGVGRKKPHSEATRKKISEAKMGVRLSPQHCANISKGITIALNAPGMHEKLVEAQRTKTWTEEHSKAASARAKNINRSPEYWAKIAKTKEENPYTHSKEVCEKISKNTTNAMAKANVIEKMKKSSAERWERPEEKKKIANKNSRTFQLTDKETGEILIVKNLASYSRETGQGLWWIHKKFQVIKLDPVIAKI